MKSKVLITVCVFTTTLLLTLAATRPDLTSRPTPASASPEQYVALIQPVSATQPPTSNQEKLGPPSLATLLTEQLASTSLPLGRGGAAANALLAAGAVNGCIIHPGEVFSFNDVVGERTTDKGYQPGRMYSQGEVVDGIGGGICKVSTALYDLALRAGLDILERRHHSGPVSYAPPGLDAAVSYGELDLRFRNNTNSPFMVKAEVADDRLVVSLVSTRPKDRSVTVRTANLERIPPPVVEVPSADVPPGHMEVLDEGRHGFRVETHRMVQHQNLPPRTELVSRDMVRPRPRVVAIPLELSEDEKIRLERLKQEAQSLNQALKGIKEQTHPAEPARPKPRVKPAQKPPNPNAEAVRPPASEAAETAPLSPPAPNTALEAQPADSAGGEAPHSDGH
jgi:hypothetical protein